VKTSTEKERGNREELATAESDGGICEKWLTEMYVKAVTGKERTYYILCGREKIEKRSKEEKVKENRPSK
jgi:hypothetical protein